MTLATQDEVIEPEIVRTHTEWAEVIKSDLGRAVEGIVSAGNHLTAAKADVNHGEWLPMLEEIGISDGYARKLMRVSRNSAISNRSHGTDLPTTFRALLELSRMDPSDIEDGIESGRITPDMEIKDARAFANNEWPDVPEPDTYTEPTQEERVRKVEETHARLVREGIIPAPLTEEELEASAKEFVESLTGKTKRTPVEPVTPEDKFAKALNAVGAAIRINHSVNEAELNEDGWNVLRALGLR